jgi:hypothetical protein
VVASCNIASSSVRETRESREREKGEEEEFRSRN